MSYFPNTETITIGGRTFNLEDSNVKVLVAGVTSTNYSTFRDSGGGFYAVPGATSFNVQAIQLSSEGANVIMKMGYSTATASDTGSAPTGFTELPATGYGRFAVDANTGAGLVGFSTNIIIGTGNYITMQGLSGASYQVTIVGTES